MREERFITLIKQEVEKWLAFVDYSVKRDEIRIHVPFTFSSILRFARSQHHYVVEFLGSQKFDPSKNGNYSVQVPRKAENIGSAEAYFAPGFVKPNISEALLDLSGSIGGSITGLGLCHSYDSQVLARKLQFRLPEALLIADFMKVPFKFNLDSHLTTFMDISIIMNVSSFLLFRHINTATIFRMNVTESDISLWMGQFIGHPTQLPGVNLYENVASEILEKDLQSLSDQNINEKILDEFLRTHLQALAESLGYKSALSQLRLKWQDKSELEESIPDFLLERSDGFFDILDIKRALLPHNKPITRGPRGRMRFGSYVSELVAQLKGYERYFANEDNAKWAYETYGVKTHDPILIGLVGNSDNFDRTEVDLALEQYRDNILLLSYQDLINILRANGARMFSR